MSIFLVIALMLAVVLIGTVALTLTGRTQWADPVQDPLSTLPPVLLPQDPRAEDVARVRLSSGLRGYRMDQVDAVLDRLEGALRARDQRIMDLEASLEGPEIGRRPTDSE